MGGILNQVIGCSDCCQAHPDFTCLILSKLCLDLCEDGTGPGKWYQSPLGLMEEPI